jgi:hypothetical protein
MKKFSAYWYVVVQQHFLWSSAGIGGGKQISLMNSVVHALLI